MLTSPSIQPDIWYGLSTTPHSVGTTTIRCYFWRSPATRRTPPTRNGTSTTQATTVQSVSSSKTLLQPAILGISTDMRRKHTGTPQFAMPAKKRVRYVMAAGTGTWDGTIVNPSNPMRRDVHLLPANGYLVRSASCSLVLPFTTWFAKSSFDAGSSMESR